MTNDQLFLARHSSFVIIKNCDMGEGMGNDHLLMPFIDAANIACGRHAGDRDTMRRTIALARAHDVQVGAHPSFDDRANFGRTEMHLPLNEVYQLVQEQLLEFQDIATSEGAVMRHVKPHGALYNMSARDPELAACIAEAIRDTDPALVVYGLSGSRSIAAARAIGLVAMNEVFADRTYQPNGQLTPRSQSGALIESAELALQQALSMARNGQITATDGSTITVPADTICLHGDGAHAVAFARILFEKLRV